MCIRDSLFIIGDEAYREFVYAGEPLQSFGEYADAAENVIVIDTVSKRCLLYTSTLFDGV